MLLRIRLGSLARSTCARHQGRSAGRLLKAPALLALALIVLVTQAGSWVALAVC